MYVRRNGRATAAQERALDTSQGRYLLTLPEAGSVDAAFWQQAFGRAAPLAIEIGFGNGAALAALAKAQPQLNCLGIDVYRPGFGALILACERDALANVRIADAEALSLLQRLPEASVHLINVFFPDPWPKKRHHKRRLVDAAFAAAAGRCLEHGGTLSLATDWDHYAEQMQTVLAAEPALAGGQCARPPDRPLTPFEAKAQQAGRGVTELRYRRRAACTPLG